MWLSVSFSLRNKVTILILKFPIQVVKKPIKCVPCSSSINVIPTFLLGSIFILSELLSISRSKEKAIFLESKSCYSQTIAIKINFGDSWQFILIQLYKFILKHSIFIFLIIVEVRWLIYNTTLLKKQMGSIYCGLFHSSHWKWKFSPKF